METYVILRRGGWRTGADLEAAADRSIVEGDQMPDDIRWIRSYVLSETDGTVGTVCIYEASSPEAIRRHALAADLPVDEIIAVADTVVVRPDPVTAGTLRKGRNDEEVMVRGCRVRSHRRKCGCRECVRR